MESITLVSANSEWQAVKKILKPASVESTPLGETFVLPLSTVARDTASHDTGTLSTGTRFFHGGWGKISAAATTQYVIDRWEPDLLVNLGTCGGFAGRVERGAIILVERTLLYDIIEQMSDPDEAIAHYATDLDLTWLDEVALRNCITSPLVRGQLLSADRDILAGDITRLEEKYGAVAADWESGAIAWVAKKNHTRCLILRGVTDLVSPAGGEAYNNIEVFHKNTRKVMQELLQFLPGILMKAYTPI
jgi:adenosylhomocysteine nucleosidase